MKRYIIENKLPFYHIFKIIDTENDSIVTRYDLLKDSYAKEKAQKHLKALNSNRNCI